MEHPPALQLLGLPGRRLLLLLLHQHLMGVLLLPGLLLWLGENIVSGYCRYCAVA